MKQGKATRQAFGESLAEWGEKNSSVVVLDADLSKSTKSEIFAKKFPERFYEMGIAEANMVGTAAGLSFTGKIPFLCSFGCFLTGRFDTIRLSVSYAEANVRLVGTHAGVGIGEDGHSQMGLEDVALMRTLPKMGVFQPADELETKEIMNVLVQDWKGPAYLRLTRQNLPVLSEGKKFQFGKATCILPQDEKHDVAFIGSGAGVSEAYQAALEVQKQGKKTSVWSVHSLKPFDSDFVKKLATQAQRIVTVEDHSVIGGLGSCVEEVLASIPTHATLTKIGVQDRFGQSGTPESLYDEYGIAYPFILKNLANNTR